MVSVDSTATLTSEMEASYDDQGRVYQTQADNVSSSGALTTNVFYDPDGDVLAVYSTGGGQRCQPRMALPEAVTSGRHYG